MFVVSFVSTNKVRALSKRQLNIGNDENKSAGTFEKRRGAAW
jgi:hypothetical protein